MIQEDKSQKGSKLYLSLLWYSSLINKKLSLKNSFVHFINKWKNITVINTHKSCVNIFLKDTKTSNKKVNRLSICKDGWKCFSLFNFIKTKPKSVFITLLTGKMLLLLINCCNTWLFLTQNLNDIWKDDWKLWF